MSDFSETAGDAVEKTSEGVTSNPDGANQREGVTGGNSDGMPKQNDIPDAPRISEVENNLNSNEWHDSSVIEDNSEKQKEGLTDEEKQKIKEETGWSDEIIDHITSMEQYEIYKNAGLHEEVINGRPCLVKDIDWDYFDPKSQMTNRERVANNKVPIDAKTGEKIELHHMGQDQNGPFAELTENSEHGDGNHITLHPGEGESWRREPGAQKQYQQERINHWKTRAEGGN